MNPARGDPAGGRPPRLLPPARVEADRRDRAPGPAVNIVLAFVILWVLLLAERRSASRRQRVDERRHAQAGAAACSSRATGSSPSTASSGDLDGAARSRSPRTSAPATPTDGCAGRDAGDADRRARRRRASTIRVTPVYDAGAGDTLLGFALGDARRRRRAGRRGAAASVDEMWSSRAGRSTTIAQHLRGRGAQGDLRRRRPYETTRQAIELERRAGALPARDHLACRSASSTCSRSCRSTAGTSSGRWPRRCAAARSRSRHGAGRLHRLRARDRAVHDRLHERHRPTDRRRLRRQVGSRHGGDRRTGPRRRRTTIAEAFRLTAEDYRRTASRSAPKDDEVSLTWAELRDRVDALAGGLAELGVRTGDTVALMLGNRPEFHIADLAVMTLGATPFSIYQTFSPEQIAYVVGDAGARVALDRGRVRSTPFRAAEHGASSTLARARGRLAPSVRAASTPSRTGARSSPTTW